MNPKYTLVTGASRGIGEAMAQYCASKGFNLILVARSKEKLQEISSCIMKEREVDVKIFDADLTASESPSRIYEFCKANGLQVDKLINNAGVGLYGRFSELSILEQLNVLQINQMSTVAMTHQFIPMLRGHAKSYILNVASTACYQPIPYMSVYAATQSFLQSFTLALRQELKPQNISVSCLCPGPTATDFFERAGLQNLAVNSSEIKMPVDEVAEVAIEGMLEGDSEIIPGTSNTIGAYFSKLLPNKFIVKTVSNLFSPKG